MEQGAAIDSAASYHLTTSQAVRLAAVGHLEQLSATVFRKTPLAGRVLPDAAVRPGHPFAMRGLSAAIGSELAKAVRRREAWALAMFALMRKKREAASCNA